jgi:hypothetical protein
MTLSGNHISLQASLRMNKEIPMVEKTLSDLFLAQLKDIYYAEKKIFPDSPQDGEGGPGARA